MSELCAQLIVLAACLTGAVDPYAPVAEKRILVAAAAQIEEAQGEPDPPVPTREQAPEPTTVGWPWGPLADCESGEWDRHAQPIPHSRRWDYGAPGAFSRPGYPFHGGLNFHPDTWRWVAELEGVLHLYPHAYDAPPSIQIQVGERTRQLQGWQAWPVCSRKVGLR